MNIHAIRTSEDTSLEYEPLVEGLHRLSYADGFQDLARRVELMPPGETLKLSVPDFASAAARYQRHDGTPLPAILGVEMGHIDAPAAWYDIGILAEIMRQAGLIDIHRWKREEGLLCLAGKKPRAALAPSADLKIVAVLSLPRLGFSTFWAMALEALAPLHIPLVDARSPFWDQGMQGGIIEAMAQEPDAILCLDYDAPFHTGTVKALHRVLREHSEVDAVVPLQSSRHNDKCLFSIDLPEGVESLDAIPESVFMHPLKSITRGHFGCTLIRASVFRTLPKPWFLNVPGQDGNYGDGRLDADVYFWKKFIDHGLRAELATRIRIGHIVEMVKVPGPDFQPRYLTPEQFRSLPHALD